MQLYSYFRSSASYRVRIALGLKGLAAEVVPVNLLTQENASEAYRRINPQGLVPALVEDGRVFTQSLAIMEYLEETHPSPPLLPNDAAGRARVRALAQAIACEMAPLNNIGVLRFLEQEFGLDKDARQRWYAHWIAKGFAALERLLAESPDTGTFCHGDTPGMIDCCLVPQLYNAKRYECNVSAYPTILRIAEACERLPAFRQAHPDQQAGKG